MKLFHIHIHWHLQNDVAVQFLSLQKQGISNFVLAWSLWDFRGTNSLLDVYCIVLEKETGHFCQHLRFKNKRSISLRTVLRIYEKFNFYKIWNKYNENIFIFSTFIIHTIIYCSNDPAYMYFLWSSALMSAPNTICDLIFRKSKTNLSHFFFLLCCYNRNAV